MKRDDLPEECKAAAICCDCVCACFVFILVAIAVWSALSSLGSIAHSLEGINAEIYQYNKLHNK